MRKIEYDITKDRFVCCPSSYLENRLIGESKENPYYHGQRSISCYYDRILAGSIAASCMNLKYSTRSHSYTQITLPDRINKELENISKLSTGWNNDSAPSFSPTLITNVKTALALLCLDDKRLMLFPTARKSVQIEWENANNDYCEIEIYSNHVSLLTIASDDCVDEQDGIDLDRACKVFDSFVSQHQ